MAQGQHASFCPGERSRAQVRGSRVPFDGDDIAGDGEDDSASGNVLPLCTHVIEFGPIVVAGLGYCSFECASSAAMTSRMKGHQSESSTRNLQEKIHVAQ